MEVLIPDLKFKFQQFNYQRQVIVVLDSKHINYIKMPFKFFGKIYTEGEFEPNLQTITKVTDYPRIQKKWRRVTTYLGVGKAP